MMTFELDLRQFRAAVEEVIKTTGKDEVEIINRAALHTVIGGKGVKGAMQRTPKAAVADINKAAPIILRMMIKRNAEQHLGLNKQEIGELVKKELRRRKASKGYTAGPGWNNAAIAFGGRGVRIQSGFQRSEAAFGSGTKAKGYFPVAVIENTSPAAEKIGQRALQDALNNVAQDITDYAAKKLQQTANRYKP